MSEKNLKRTQKLCRYTKSRDMLLVSIVASVMYHAEWIGKSMNFLIHEQQEASDLPRSSLASKERPPELLCVSPSCRNTCYVLAIHASGNCAPSDRSLPSGGIVRSEMHIM